MNNMWNKLPLSKRQDVPRINRIHCYQPVAQPGTDTEPETFGISLQEFVAYPSTKPVSYRGITFRVRQLYRS